MPDCRLPALRSGPGQPAACRWRTAAVFKALPAMRDQAPGRPCPELDLEPPGCAASRNDLRGPGAPAPAGDRRGAGRARRPARLPAGADVGQRADLLRRCSRHRGRVGRGRQPSPPRARAGGSRPAARRAHPSHPTVAIGPARPKFQPAIGASPSGKAADFDSAIRRFDPCRPSQPIRANTDVRRADARLSTR